MISKQIMIKQVVLVAVSWSLFSCEPSTKPGEQTTTSDTVPAQKQSLDMAEETVLLTANTEQKQLLERYRQMMNAIDQTYADDPAQIELYMKLAGRDRLLRVKNFDDAPENLVTSYNLFRDARRNVRYVLESPFSASGDWVNTYSHYFHETGRTLAFVRTSAFFDSTCAKASIREISAYFFDQNGKLIQKTYERTDGKGDSLTAAPCELSYRFPYRIYKNLADLRRQVPLP